MQKVGFRGKSGANFFFSDEMRTKYNYNTDHDDFFRAKGLLYSITATLIQQHMMRFLEAAVQHCWYSLALHICDNEHM